MSIDSELSRGALRKFTGESLSLRSLKHTGSLLVPPALRVFGVSLLLSLAAAQTLPDNQKLSQAITSNTQLTPIIPNNIEVLPTAAPSIIPTPELSRVAIYNMSIDNLESHLIIPRGATRAYNGTYRIFILPYGIKPGKIYESDINSEKLDIDLTSKLALDNSVLTFTGTMGRHWNKTKISGWYSVIEGLDPTVEHSLAVTWIEEEPEGMWNIDTVWVDEQLVPPGRFVLPPQNPTT